MRRAFSLTAWWPWLHHRKLLFEYQDDHDIACLRNWTEDHVLEVPQPGSYIWKMKSGNDVHSKEIHHFDDAGMYGY